MRLPGVRSWRHAPNSVGVRMERLSLSPLAVTEYNPADDCHPEPFASAQPRMQDAAATPVLLLDTSGWGGPSTVDRGRLAKQLLFFL